MSDPYDRIAEAIERRGAEVCAMRQGHAHDCSPYLARGRRCPDCPRDHYEEAADLARNAEVQQ